MRTLLGPRAQGLRWRAIPLLVLAGTLALTVAYWQHERLAAQASQRQAFDDALRDTGQRIEQRVAGYEHLLQGVQGFLAASAPFDKPASHAELGPYVDALPLGADFAGVQGIAVARRMAALGGAVVTQVEPPELARNSGVLGVDLMSRPVARRVLEQARDSGHMALSTKLDLQALDLGASALATQHAGFLMVLPVYRTAVVPDSLAQRREDIQAWVVAAVSAPELMASLYGELPEGLGLRLYDDEQLADDSELYHSTGDLADVQRSAKEFLVIGGHTWTLLMNADQGFNQRHGGDDGSFVLWTGALLALLLALLSGLMGSAREHAQALAERMTRALRESEKRWAFALEGAGDGVWDWDLKRGTVSSSARWKAMLGLDLEAGEPTPQALRALVHPEDMPRAQAEMQRCLDGMSPNLTSEFRVAGNGREAEAHWNWVMCRGTVVERDSQQRPLRMIGTLSDINARRLSEERVRFMALHDPLTELANRAHFDERLHFAIANARRYNESLGLILLDLDRFKPINDQYGHAVGDQLLQTVAKRIKGSVRETDTVGRIGGDEFVVLLTGPVTRDTAQVVVDKIFNQVALPMEFGGARIEITCSMGLALYPDDGVDELSLTKAADDAMYRNKRTGRPWTTGSSKTLGDLSGR